MYGSVASPYCIPETHSTLYANHTGMKMKRNKNKDTKSICSLQREDSWWYSRQRLQRPASSHSLFPWPHARPDHSAHLSLDFYLWLPAGLSDFIPFNSLLLPLWAAPHCLPFRSMPTKIPATFLNIPLVSYCVSASSPWHTLRPASLLLLICLRPFLSFLWFPKPKACLSEAFWLTLSLLWGLTALDHTKPSSDMLDCFMSSPPVELAIAWSDSRSHVPSSALCSFVPNKPKTQKLILSTNISC